VFENSGARLWTTGDGIGVLSFKSKLHVIGDDVLDGVLESLSIAEQRFDGLVVWQTEAPFSAGANLAQAVPVVLAGDFATFENTVAKFQRATRALLQRATRALRYSAIPVVGATQGLALGGGCEFLMHCDRVAAALESYIGLVEVGVGLIPAGGGCKEFAARAAAEAKGGDLLPFLRSYFEAMAMAKVSRSAEEAKQIGYLKPSDIIIFNPHELLYVAKAQARALAEAGYRPPQPRLIRVAGRTGSAAWRGGPAAPPARWRWSTCATAVLFRRMTTTWASRSPRPCAAAKSIPTPGSRRTGCWDWSARRLWNWRKRR